ncbi:hypothetical protein ACFY40_11405 [Streptomyces sp. NPDC012950]|uniref:recombination directionality factor n=1 Tax=Streptomyces sp. NPDC012950 TaxID=3364858 RepID=UPI0036B0394B
MGSRILTMKRQAAELGRIRTGYSRPHEDPKKRRVPVKSQTFILSSHSREYVERAAELYGGRVEEWTPQNTKIAQYRVITEARELRAILPAGDPLSQSYEMWSGGGCARRCDGTVEKLSGKSCICLARYGEGWHERKPDEVCRPTSRIGVFLPDLPDLGVWRLETKSYYAADAIAGGLDTVLQATGGKGLLPVRMWIEQRTAVRNGKTKQFQVVMLVPALPKLRHALSGPISTAAALDPSTLDRPAIEAARPDYAAEARLCTTADAVLAVYTRARAAGHGTPELRDELRQIADDIAKGVDTSTGVVEEDQDDDELLDGPDDEGVYDGEFVEDEPTTGVGVDFGTNPPTTAWPAVAQPGGGAR